MSTGLFNSDFAFTAVSTILKPKNSMADGIVWTGIVPSGASLPNTNSARFLNASTSACLLGDAFVGVFLRAVLDSGLATDFRRDLGVRDAIRSATPTPEC